MTSSLKHTAIIISLVLLAQCAVPALLPVSANPDGDEPQVIVEAGQQRLLLPTALKQLLRRRFRSYYVPTRYTGGQWTRFSGTRVVPYGTWGDFNGDGRTDIALLFTRSPRPRMFHLWYVYVFFQDVQGQYSEKSAFELDDFRHGSSEPRPIQSYRLTVHKADAPIRSDDLTLPYTYPLDSIALVRLEPKREEIERIYAWDPKLNVIRRTILDALGREAVVKSPVFDRPQGVGCGAERTLGLPWALNALLARDFPDLRLPGLPEMNKGRWATVPPTDALPWAAWADYNGDDLTDIALILVDRATGGARDWNAVAFLQTDNHSFEAHGLERFHEEGEMVPAPSPQNYAVVTAPAGSKRIVSRNEDRYRFNTILLIAFVERHKPLRELKGAAIRQWRPRLNGFFGGRFGHMTD